MGTACHTPFHVSVLLLALTLAVAPLDAQQVADTSFRPPIEKPAYPMGKGPVVLVDEAHDNFHTSGGHYQPFSELLRRDGYVVNPSASPFTLAALAAARLLVIANARQALTVQEISAVHEWVQDGGSLLLIADHPPFSGPAGDLGKVFGIRFLHVIAYKDRSGRLVFRRSEGTLLDHVVTQGIDRVATFAGSSFQLEGPGEPILVFGPEVRGWQPSDSSEVTVEGHLQGAVLDFGIGKVAVFGEAAMFSAQLAGSDRHPMGMNALIAKQNPQFLLNVIHWLTGVM